jgi:hypothetical protein
VSGPAEPTPVRPRYGDGSLADLLPSLLARIGAAGFADRLGLADGGPASAAVVLLVDGLGSALLAEHADAAPYLAALTTSGRRLTTGFPSTTAASIASLATGRPPGSHGLVGYRIATPDRSAVLNTLRWRIDGREPPDPPDPRAIQPDPTLFEQAAPDVSCWLAAPAAHERSGLTAAVWRGGSFAAADDAGRLVVAVGGVIAPGALVVAYYGELDRVGHVDGPGGERWRAELAVADRLAERLAATLPPGGTLAVTGDHGMVRVDEPARVDIDARPDLMAGVRLVGGEPRARHLYTVAGAADDVAAAWRAALGWAMWVRTADEAIADGWFGPSVGAGARAGIGDVVAVAHGDLAVVRRQAERMESGFAGHHGSLTQAEALVPLLVVG